MALRVPRILLVEDDVDVQPLLEHILLDADFEVTAVETQGNAVALLDRQPFDLVVTDVNLPDGSGLKVADRARELGVRALVVTGQGRSLKSGMLAGYDYLLKPLHVREFVEAVRRRLPRDEGGVVPFPKP